MVLVRRPYLRLTLAIIWMMLSDSYSLDSFVAGFIMATLVVGLFPAPIVQLSRVRFGSPLGFIRWLGPFFRLLFYFLWEMVLANLQVTRLVLTRKLALKPGVIAMTLRAQSPGQIALLSSLITLTPGTVVIDVAPDNSAIYIHSIDATDEAAVLSAPRRFEAMIMEVIP